MRSPALLAAALLVCLTNLGALGLGAMNRSSVESEVTLTERELRLTTVRSSVMLLRLHWHQPSPSYFRGEMIRSAGFSPPADPLLARRQLQRRVYVALEYDGAAWRTYRDTTLRHDPPAAPGPSTPDQAGRQPRAREQNINTHSRLFAIDLDTDAARLRSRHPDRSRTVIAMARASLISSYERANPVVVSVIQVTPDQINMPRPFSVTLRTLTQDRFSAYGDPLGSAPRYAVRIRYGRFHEPWIADVHSLNPKP